MTKLYLDDYRRPPDSSWAVVRSFDEFKQWIETNGLPDIVSFDFDLSRGYTSEDFKDYKNGLHCATWMLENHGCPKRVRIHSQHFAGRIRLRILFANYTKGGSGAERKTGL